MFFEPLQILDTLRRLKFYVGLQTQEIRNHGNCKKEIYH